MNVTYMKQPTNHDEDRMAGADLAFTAIVEYANGKNAKPTSAQVAKETADALLADFAGQPSEAVRAELEGFIEKMLTGP